jgi:endonuclease-3 related protein
MVSATMNNTIHTVFCLLLDKYGPQGWWPVNGIYFSGEENPFEIAVGAVLTQNTAWENAEKALERLRKRGLLTAEAIVNIPVYELANVIRPSGFYNQKAERLQLLCKFYLRRVCKNESPDRDELLNLKGIGPETADSILLYAFHIPLFVIDTYTRRIFIRIGSVSEGDSYEKLQSLFMNSIPRDEKVYNEYHALIVRHGKDICRKTPRCPECVVNREGLCRFGTVNSL